MSLLKDVEELFANSEQRVLAAFPAVKCSSSLPGIGGKRKLPKPDGKPRVLVITAKRRSKKRGFKGTLHVAKLSQGKYQVRRSVRLKHLTRMEAFIDSPGQQEYLELLFVQRGFTGGESRLAFEVRNAMVRLELLASLFNFCRAHEKRPPSVVGVEVSELEAASMLYGKSTEDRPKAGAAGTALSPLSSQTLQSTPSAGILYKGAEGGVGSTLWGQREDRQLEGLLEAVAGGAGSMEEMQERLTTELAALEDASVHEILENGGAVLHVLEGLDTTLGLLDDLEENLHVFDTKLRHMREDIAAIEDRNNRLERQSRNNQALLDTLDSLVRSLTLSQHTEEVLRRGSLSPANLDSVVAAAWELQPSLEALSPPHPQNPALATHTPAGTGATSASSSAPAAGKVAGIPRGLGNMSAVVAQRQRLHDVMRVFLNRATSHLSEQLRLIADSAMTKVAALTGPSRLRPPDHATIRRRCAELAPLMEVVRVMRPAASGGVREAYCQSVNAVLIKELHGAVSEGLRGMHAMEAAGGGAEEPDVMAKKKDSLRVLDRLSTTPSRQPSDFPSSRSSAATPLSTLKSLPRGGLPLHEAYQQLLGSFLPLLAEEAINCIALLFPPPPSPPNPTSLTSADAGSALGATHSAGVEEYGRTKSVRFGRAAQAGEGGGEGAGSPPSSRPPPPPSQAASARVDAASPEVLSSVGMLFQGVEREIMPLVDSARSQHSLLCLPMLGTTLEWGRKLAGSQGCGPLLRMLASFEGRLRSQLDAYVEDRVGAIQRYDGRSSMAGGSVKRVHVLPFILNFQALAQRVEELLQSWGDPGEGATPGLSTGAVTPKSPGSAWRSPETGVGGQGALVGSAAAAHGAGSRDRGTPSFQAASSQQGALMPSPFDVPTQRRFTTVESFLREHSSDAERSTAEEGSGDFRARGAAAEATEGTELSFMSSEGGAGEEGEVTPPATSGLGPAAREVSQEGDFGSDSQQLSIGSILREVADGMYERVLGAMLRAVESAAGSDPKHGQRLRLENYSCLNAALQALPTPRVPVLHRFLHQLGGLSSAAMRAYVEQQLDYFKFTRVMELSRKLEELMQSVGPQEVPFQLSFQAQEVKHVLSSCMAGVDKKLAQVRSRIQKHLGGSSPRLVEEVWGRVEGVCLERWGRVGEQVRVCYPGMSLQPTLPDLRRMLQEAARASS